MSRVPDFTQIDFADEPPGGPMPRAAVSDWLTPEERSRQLLGLPLDRRLSENEIHRAYKLLAKRTHPDAGGSEEAFLRISAAHEALMKERRMPPRH